MLKYVIELKTNPEDNDDEMKFKRMMKSDEAFGALWDIKMKLREIWKYEEGLSEETFKKVEEIREFIFDTLYEHGINLDLDYN